jgi:hypothetical protein
VRLWGWAELTSKAGAQRGRGPVALSLDARPAIRSIAEPRDGCSQVLEMLLARSQASGDGNKAKRCAP